MKRLNDTTPADWDGLRKSYPAIEGKPHNKWIGSAMKEAHAYAEELETTSKLPTDAAERKAIPIYTGFINYFPLAIAAVSKVSLTGGLQHGQTSETLHWDRSKSGDEKDAMMRHILDGDWAQVAWRAMANLEKSLEESI